MVLFSNEKYLFYFLLHSNIKTFKIKMRGHFMYFWEGTIISSTLRLGLKIWPCCSWSSVCFLILNIVVRVYKYAGYNNQLEGLIQKMHRVEK